MGGCDVVCMSEFFNPCPPSMKKRIENPHGYALSPVDVNLMPDKIFLILRRKYLDSPSEKCYFKAPLLYPSQVNYSLLAGHHPPRKFLSQIIDNNPQLSPKNFEVYNLIGI